MKLKKRIIPISFMIFCIIFVLMPNKNKMLYNDKNNIQVSNFNTINHPVIEKVNRLNSNIKNISCENLKMKTSRRWIKLTGSLYYEKIRNFRFKVYHFSLENDLGSNEYLFWFWNKRMKPNYLYYSMYKNLYNTRLKTPFNPLWMMESLSVNKINTRNVSIEENDKYLKIYENRRSTSNKEVVKLTIINKENNFIIGHYLYYKNKLIASSEVKETQNIDGHIIPKILVFTWHEENEFISIEFVQPKVNQKISNRTWEMPNIDPIKNIGI